MSRKVFIQATLGLSMLLFSCTGKSNKTDLTVLNSRLNLETSYSKLDTATFAGGCFWCTEAVFERLAGVEAVISGYAGGDASNANYKAVSNGVSNHTETIQIFFNPEIISFRKLLEVFMFSAHDPTQLNRQGPDIGRQYRSSIFYHNPSQKKKVEELFVQIKDQKIFSKPITTEVIRYSHFYEAEDYHQDFYELNPNNPYIVGVAVPKVSKFEVKYKNLLKLR
ncbi:MAG: peptide-methionine (S)-S-oxide reductase [Sphingobacteriales bacterium]|jgi:peptide-methionine (S)-S-oxide reductase